MSWDSVLQVVFLLLYFISLVARFFIPTFFWILIYLLLILFISGLHIYNQAQIYIHIHSMIEMTIAFLRYKIWHVYVLFILCALHCQSYLPVSEAASRLWAVRVMSVEDRGGNESVAASITSSQAPPCARVHDTSTSLSSSGFLNA